MHKRDIPRGAGRITQRVESVAPGAALIVGIEFTADETRPRRNGINSPGGRLEKC